MITPVAFETIGYKTYVIFAVINLAMFATVYAFYPETAYRSLEEIDSIFRRVHDTENGSKGAAGWWRPFLDVRQAARDEPRRYGRNGELILVAAAASDEEAVAVAGMVDAAVVVAVAEGGVSKAKVETVEKTNGVGSSEDSIVGSSHVESPGLSEKGSPPI